MVTAEDLIAFEAEVADKFNQGAIRAPVHLSGGNEAQLIEYFAAHWRPGDWVVSTWRSHYHCLLAQVPPERLMADIIAGRSITLCYPEHRVLSSAIVAGGLPIATGIAMGVKRDGGKEHIHCFLGDMAAETGAFIEAVKYATGQDLPITFIVEDNGKSVMTDTLEAWGGKSTNWGDLVPNVRVYQYELTWPHSGAGTRVEF